jgi:hypothetical protein
MVLTILGYSRNSKDIKANLLIGNNSIPLYSVSIATAIFRVKKCAEFSQDYQNLLQAMTMFTTSGIIRRFNTRPNLLKLLSRCSAFDATDARDKLFSIFGLSFEGQQLEINPLIQPNYRKSIVETFAHLVQYLISSPRG